jgi:RimJ/RimL family protein N-acetyltransferase
MPPRGHGHIIGADASRAGETLERVQTVFETERLVVTPWRDDHAATAHAAYSQAEFVRYLGNPVPHPDLAYTRAWIARITDGFWAVEAKPARELVGAAVLKPLPGGDGEWEVGWHVFPAHQRQGYATEIGRGGIRQGFSNGLNEIFAIVRPENAPSLAVARKLGMQPLGQTDRYYGVTAELFVIRPGD